MSDLENGPDDAAETGDAAQPSDGDEDVAGNDVTGQAGEGDDGKPGAPKRKGKTARKHTVGKVLLASVLVLALATGLGVTYLYRHLNGNLNVVDVTGQLENRPEKKQVEGPAEPLNILVMGSDERFGPNSDGSARSDTTILMHLSADRQRAYGISIPRDSLVTRPSCKQEDGTRIPGGTDVMWNEAFQLGGPACTIQQFEQTTGVFIDHYVVVNFESFENMVDAIDGVPVCIPEPVVDPEHNINIPAGTREIQGKEALSYVRARYTLGDGSDISRIKRQQAFIAGMVHKVMSAGTLTRLDRLVRFLDAATKALQTDMDNVVKIAKVGVGFQNIGLDNIQFLTVPIEYDQRPEYAGRVVWTPAADKLWAKIAADEPLSKQLTADSINAAKLPGADESPNSKDPSSSRPSGQSSSSVSPSDSPSSAAEAEANGLCA
ncbi:LCP family protein [Nocardioides taihuensis]|uniref:LCP family protein n=1 Tax=Nocardioides taihuensis TaxID=1835606 RepID=A0ABW0BHY7_9ACTN